MGAFRLFSAIGSAGQDDGVRSPVLHACERHVHRRLGVRAVHDLDDDLTGGFIERRRGIEVVLAGEDLPARFDGKQARAAVGAEQLLHVVVRRAERSRDCRTRSGSASTATRPRAPNSGAYDDMSTRSALRSSPVIHAASASAAVQRARPHLADRHGPVCAAYSPTKIFGPVRG